MEHDVTQAYAPHQPALTWSAVLGGVFAALATSLALTLAATGIGYSLSSNLANPAAQDAFTPIVGVTIIVIQVLSAALGGYLAGRLRTPWHTVHGHEAHFRDTAHGLIVWAVATVASAAFATNILGPSAESVHPAVTAAVASGADAARLTSIAAQSALFMAVGLFTSAFVAAVAARLGGMETEAAHAKVHPVHTPTT